MSIRQLKEADYLLSECGRPVPPAGARYVDLPHCLTFRQQITPSVGSSLAMSFPFFPDTITFQQDYFEQGVTGESAPPTAPEITAVSGFNNTGNQVDQPGPWSDGGNRRFMILYQYGTSTVTPKALRAYKSTDAGITWAEVDAAHAPSLALNNVAPGDYANYGVARDSRPAVRKIYCAVWDTDFTVSQITFDMSTELWGVKVKSTLAILSTAIEPDSGFTTAYSPSDNSLVVAFNVESVLIGGNQYDRSDYAKFNITTQTWDAAWTRCGTADSTIDARAWLVQGACVDQNNNIHFQFNVGAGGVAAQALYHQVLHPNNTLSTSDLVISVPHAQLLGDYLCRPLARPIPSGGTEILFGFFEFNNPTHSTFIARGVASDAPAWTIERPLPAVPNTTQYEGFALVNVGQGVVQAVYIEAKTAANVATYAAVSNAGPGLGWSAPVVLGTSTWGQTLQAGAPSFFSANQVSTLLSGSLSITTRIENKSRVPFICRGVSILGQAGLIPFRLWLKTGRNLEQTISAANFAGQGAGLRTLQPEVQIDPGAKVMVELLQAPLAAASAKPVQVDTSAQSSGLAGTGFVSEGPYQTLNGDLYCVLITQNGPPFTINVYRSTNGGVTWQQQDAADSLATVGSAVFQCVFNPAGNGLITIAYQETGHADPNTVRWAKFDCGTKLFTNSILPDLTDVAISIGLPGIPFVIRADGSYLVTYLQNTGTFGFRTNVAGVWSAFTILENTAAHAYNPQGVYLDATQVSHVIFGDKVAGVTTWFHLPISSLNVAGAAGSIAVATASDVLGQGVISGGTLYLPLARGAGNSKATIFSGTPLSAPVWTVTDLQTALTNNIVSVSVAVVGGQPTALWDYENVPGTINVIYKSTLAGGVWGTPSVFYDVNANPPNSVAPSSQTVSEVVAFVNGAGVLSALVTMLDPTLAFSAFYFTPAIAASGITFMYFWGVLRFMLDASGDEPAPYLPDTARTPRIPGTQNQNIMAPEWMLGNQCTPETPPGYWDEPFTLHSDPIKNAVGQTNVGNSVNVPDDCAVFIVRNVQYNSVPDAGVTGAATVNIRLPEGYSLTDRDYLPQDWTGPLFPLLNVEAGGRIILDVGDMDASGAGNITTTVQFDGVKRRRL